MINNCRDRLSLSRTVGVPYGRVTRSDSPRRGHETLVIYSTYVRTSRARLIMPQPLPGLPLALDGVIAELHNFLKRRSVKTDLIEHLHLSSLLAVRHY